MMKKQIFLIDDAYKKYLSLGGYRAKKLSKFLDNIIYDNIKVDPKFYIPKNVENLKQIQIDITKKTNDKIKKKACKERITSNEFLNYVIIKEV